VRIGIILDDYFLAFLSAESQVKSMDKKVLEKMKNIEQKASRCNLLLV